MDEHEWLAKRFGENRIRLRAVAYRTLGWVWVSAMAARLLGGLPGERG
jgi:hypothetical protein